MPPFDIKPCAIAAAAAFLLSFVMGLVSDVGFLAVLARAVVLSVLFFSFVAGAQMLISRFLPELLGDGPAVDASSPGDEEGPRPGAQVDVSIGDDSDSVSQFASAEAGVGQENEFDSPSGDSSGELPGELPGGPGDSQGAPLSANSSPGLDQEREGGYTVTGSLPGSKTAAVAARPPELIGDVDVLPDLDGLSDSFITPVSVGGDGVGDEGNSGYSSRSAASPAGSESSGEFDAKEMAMAIQTMLKRDEKG